MTTQQKNKASLVLEWVYKMLVLTGVAGVLISIGAAKAEINTKTFDTIEDKVNTKNHISNTLSEMDIYNLKNHIHNPVFHMPRDAKDSIYVPRTEFEEWVKKDIITNYQQKQEITSIKEDQKELKSLVKAVLNEVNK